MLLPSRATECQVARNRLPTVLLRDDVINGERVEGIVVLVNAAVLAPVGRSLLDEDTQSLIHWSRRPA